MPFVSKSLSISNILLKNGKEKLLVADNFKDLMFNNYKIAFT